MKKRIAFCLLGVAALLLTAAGCGSVSRKEESADGQKEASGALAETVQETEENEENIENKEEDLKLVGVFLPGKAEDPRGSSIARRMETKLVEEGCQPRIFFAEEDAALQETQIREFLESGGQVDAVVADPADPYGLSEVLDSCTADVISYDTLIMDTLKVSCYVAFDMRQIGKDTAREIVTRLGLETLREEGQTRTIELLMGSPDDLEALFFYNGVMEILDPYLQSGTLAVPSGKISFEDTAIMDLNPQVAVSHMEQILDGFYQTQRPDAILAGDPALALAVLPGLYEEGRYPREGETLLATRGTEAESVKAIAEGKIDFSMFLDAYTLADTMAKTVGTLLSGEKPENADASQYDNGKKIVQTVTCLAELIDQDNYQMLVDNGYYEEEEVAPEIVETPVLTEMPFSGREDDAPEISVSPGPV
ncbi:MAG: substrate-binding domain-containing protein [Blautia sp.]|nr:substrate-binding domain-containing protein [Blautia sp.]